MVTHGISRLWYRITDPQYLDFIVASRRLRLLDARLSEIVQTNSAAISNSYDELRKAEEISKTHMNIFRTRIQFREQQFRQKMAQRGVTSPVFSKRDIESWLSAEDIELQFRCIQDRGHVERIRNELQVLQTTHSCLNTNLNIVRGWNTQLKLGEHARVMSSLLKDIDGVILKDISEKFDANLNKLDAALAKLSMFAESGSTSVSPPQVDSSNDHVVVSFWEDVLENASVVGPNKNLLLN